MSKDGSPFFVSSNAIDLQDSPTVNHGAQSGSPRVAPKEEVQNGTRHQAEMAVCCINKLQDDLRKMALTIKQHEDNFKFLKGLINRLDESILDKQVILGKYHTATEPLQGSEDHAQERSEEEIVEQILKHEKSVAAIYFQLLGHGTRGSSLPETKDLLGIVATLGGVDDDNLSWILSEYLGHATMLALVSKSLDGVKALEKYNNEGLINTSVGIHGLGASTGRQLDGRYTVICLESIPPYVGHHITDDPQRRLDLRKPRLPNGEAPSGFLGFAVNMIHLDSEYLFCTTSTGHGLRETLFYSLFSRLQVYKTRVDMLQALPCISNGAVSLDGGMVKQGGIFVLGNTEDVKVKFSKGSSRSSFPEYYFETENQIKEMNWEKERMVDDMRREQELLERTKCLFDVKKQEFLKFLAESSTFVSQQQLQTGRKSQP